MFVGKVSSLTLLFKSAYFASGIFDLKSIDHYTGHDDVDTDD